MYLGISSYTFPWSVGVNDFAPVSPMQAADLMRFAAQKQIRFVQYGDNLPLHLLQENELLELKSKAQQLSITIQAGTRKLTVENAQAYITIAKTLGSDFVRMVIDEAGYEPTADQVIAIIKELLPLLKDQHVCLAIENHDRFPVKTLKHIIESTDPQWIAICLDTANSLGAGEGIREVVETLAPYTINLRVKDFVIQRLPHKMGFTITGCAAGDGVLNIPWVINEIGKYGRCKTATLEVWSEPGETIETTIHIERAWVEKSINYLKTIIS